MRKIIGIGETILDIIFKGNCPVQALPGGSTFNTMVSLGRLKIPARFITEVGRDKVGSIILDFMRENNLSTENVHIFEEECTQSAISLAFLNEQNDAQYAFYSRFPEKRLNCEWPVVEADDLLIFGSFYAVDPLLRDKIREFVTYAKAQKAIIYYDVNFRKSHAHEIDQIMPAFIENIGYADIVRGSAEDFEILLQERVAERVYRDYFSSGLHNFIYTDGGNGVDFFSPSGYRHIDTPSIKTVSTIGAGDSFNAGILFGLWQKDIGKEEISALSLNGWEEIIKYGISFSAEVCQSYDNYISLEFAAQYR